MVRITETTYGILEEDITRAKLSELRPKLYAMTKNFYDVSCELDRTEALVDKLEKEYDAIVDKLRNYQDANRQ